jgi:hypothetical protein
MERSFYMQLLELVDRQRVHNGRRVGLRDALILSLRADGLTVRELRLINADDLVQHEASGVFYARVVRRGVQTLIRLRPLTCATALEYLEQQRSYGERRPLFESGRRQRRRLSPGAIKDVQRLYARQLRRVR